MKRGSGAGRPTGTDGSDFSYRMTVDNKYKRAARARMQLRKFVAIQAVFVLFKALWATLMAMNGEDAKSITVASCIFGAAAVFIGTLGLKTTASPHLLKLYMLLTGTSLSLYLLPLLSGEFFTEWSKKRQSGSNTEFTLANLEVLQEFAGNPSANLTNITFFPTGIFIQCISVSTALTLSSSIAL